MNISNPPTWFDEKIDYTAPRFQEALAFGRAAAKNVSWDWDRAEVSLAETWSMSSRQGRWMDIRGAVFYAWDEARLSLPAKQDWSDDVLGF